MYDIEVILVHNHKGGTGKTMLAVHLAEHLADVGQKWTLLDIDEQANAISWLTGHSWQGEDTIRLPGHEDRAELMATTDPLNANDFDHVIVDTPPADSLIESITQYIPLVPEILIVCPVNGRLAIDGAIKVAEEVRGTGCRIVLVPNLTDPREGHAREEISAIERLVDEEDLNVEVFRLAIPRNERYMREAELKGVPIWDLAYAERTHTAQAVRAFCQWVADGARPEANRREAHRDAMTSTYAVSRKLSRRLWNH